MKLYSFLILLLIFTTYDCKAQETKNFDWMTGEWIRTNGSKGIITSEKWKKVSDTIYIGTGFTEKNAQIVFKENLRLLRNKNKWIYEVTGVNEDTTNFVLTEISDNSFIAINPENPFPKVISYHAKNGKLIAEISNDSKNIVFEFQKKDQK